jgi:hypothetical protein
MISTPRRLAVLAALTVFTVTGVRADDEAAPLAAWRRVKVTPVASGEHHSIHAYFNTSPESPDGRWVLYYASTTESGEEGEIRIQERSSGKVRVLSRGVSVEDAHRAACQQWVSHGKRVVYHQLLPGGTSVVMSVDVDSGQERLLARGRQVGFGQPHSDLVPIYGPHWAPGPHRDLELLDVATGVITKAPLTARGIEEAYPEWVQRQFGGGPLSIYIPMLSPDQRRVFFKMAKPAGGHFRSGQASRREGLLCYDLKEGRLLPMREKWGHPAWHPDSRRIINVPEIVIDSDTGRAEPIAGCPRLSGSHPSFAPDGRLFTSDTTLGQPPGWWSVGVGDTRSGEFVRVHSFDNAKGARSWRVSHPHPVFSADGKRLYFNVSADSWTRLYVAEAAPTRPD